MYSYQQHMKFVPCNVRQTCYRSSNNQQLLHRQTEGSIRFKRMLRYINTFILFLDILRRLLFI
jgi:hypothetical protein